MVFTDLSSWVSSTGGVDASDSFETGVPFALLTELDRDDFTVVADLGTTSTGSIFRSGSAATDGTVGLQTGALQAQLGKRTTFELDGGFDGFGFDFDPFGFDNNPPIGLTLTVDFLSNGVEQNFNANFTIPAGFSFIGVGVGPGESLVRVGFETSEGGTGTANFDFVRLSNATASSVVPEPASLALLAAGVTGVAVLRRRRGA
ncbi:MAG: PEP-CTERM sorting domain-containing protein [Planctomycetota bacterium]